MVKAVLQLCGRELHAVRNLHKHRREVTGLHACRRLTQSPPRRHKQLRQMRRRLLRWAPVVPVSHTLLHPDHSTACQAISSLGTVSRWDNGAAMQAHVVATMCAGLAAVWRLRPAGQLPGPV